jgi:hypothetical protein
MSTLIVDSISTPSGNRVINVNNLYASNYNVNVLNVQTNSTTYNFGTGWGLGPTFSNITGFLPSSLIFLQYHMPCRNDSTSWGGMYIEPQVSFNGSGTWQSLGSCGYDGSVMNLGNGAIGSYYNSILIDPGLTSTFSAQFRFYFRSYDSTSILNGSHDINSISGTAALMSGINGQQHFSKIIVQGISPLST